MRDRDYDNGNISRAGRREQAIELSVFLFLIAPSMAFSFFLVKTGNVGFVLTAVSTILRDLALVGLILFFLWRNGESPDSLGWTAKARGKDIFIGMLLFLPFFFGMGILDNSLQAIGFSASKTPLPSFLHIKGSNEVILAFVLVLVVAISEEIIFRGYLILRLKAITGSSAAAAFLSAVIFSLGHGYEGTAGVITVGGAGLMLALVYLWRKSLVASITMHFLLDTISIILVPMLGTKAMVF